MGKEIFLEIIIYRPGTFVRGIPVTASMLVLMLSQGDGKPKILLMLKNKRAHLILILIKFWRNHEYPEILASSFGGSNRA
ncbi:MAG TPA: hypothetical protein HA304_05060 [Methanosarcinales archaeon]|nr:hypothetical protein [Methanosarcinales archaeon]